MKRILAVIGLLACSVGAMADTGNDILEQCKAFIADDGALFKSGQCSGRIDTLIDLNKDLAKLLKNDGICFPAGVTNGQIGRVVVKYLEGRPENLHDAGTPLLYFALYSTWPCKR